jgi:hypothetical protein
MIAVPETVPSEFILALNENCLLTVLPSVFWSRIVPWPEADGLRAAADVDRNTKVVAAMAVINNPAKRNFLLRLILSPYDLHGPSVRTGGRIVIKGEMTIPTHIPSQCVASAPLRSCVFLVRKARTI